jgi:hypothetical protein
LLLVCAFVGCVDGAANVGDIVGVIALVVVRVECCQGGDDGCFLGGVVAAV